MLPLRAVQIAVTSCKEVVHHIQPSLGHDDITQQYPLMMQFPGEIRCKWTNHLRFAHCCRERGERKKTRWVSKQLWWWRATDSETRETQSCVYPTVLCLLVVSFCLDGRTFPKLNDFGALGILDWWDLGGGVNFGNVFGSCIIIGVIYRLIRKKHDRKNALN